jgi:hypothetical protein
MCYSGIEVSETGFFTKALRVEEISCFLKPGLFVLAFTEG